MKRQRNFDSLKRLVRRGWFEEYECGCVSETVRTRKELAGYCGQHGGDRKGVFREAPGVAVQVERITPNNAVSGGSPASGEPYTGRAGSVKG